jgi:cytochrome c biogenesis protein CcmG/thiol:disulfide interchange protein DsbE
VRLELPAVIGGRRVKPAAIIVTVASILLAVFAVVVLTSSVSAGSKQLKPAQPFSLGELGHPDTQVSLAGFAGRPVIVNFFASWCPPCRAETPLLAGFYRAHHGQVAVLGIDDNDGTSKALAFLREHGADYPVGFDPSASVTTLYGVAGLPQTFFLNAKHQIVRHVLGVLTTSELDKWAASLAHQHQGGSG